MQRSVEEFVRRHGLSCGVQVRYMDLVSEVGELGKEIVKGSDTAEVRMRMYPVRRMRWAIVCSRFWHCVASSV